MPKFFVPREQLSDNRLFIDSDDAAHIRRVLRLSPGAVITVCDGQGFDYEAEILRISEKTIECGIISKKKADTEPNIEVTLFQGLPKASKMDYIIQKTTELGIARIVPCVMNRCVVKLEGEKAERKKQERWQKIAREAAKQSGRGIVPEVCMPANFAEALTMLKRCDLCFAPYECETENTLKSTLLGAGSPKSVGFIIGPEGGFDLKEYEMLKSEGITAVTLGRRILRTETAGEAVLAMTMYEIGDINSLHF